MQRIDGGKIVFVCPDELRDRLEKIAKRNDITLSEAIRRTLDFGADIYEDLEKVGFVSLVESFVKAKKSVKGSIQKRLFA